MKADGVQKKSELEYIKRFLVSQFGINQAKQLLQIFKKILEQEYSLNEVCSQIKTQMDKPSRLQLIHVLFGLSQSDGDVHPEEVRVIHDISNLLGISNSEYQSIESMFKEDLDSAYKVLGIESNVTDLEIKKAYRRMANKFHPDKIAHLGEEYKEIAQDKFKSVSDAYHKIKKDRNIK
jgi:DnaJ like chaperone protein